MTGHHAVGAQCPRATPLGTTHGILGLPHDLVTGSVGAPRWRRLSIWWCI